MKYFTLMFLIILSACAPSPAAVQAAIQQTQDAAAAAAGQEAGEEQRVQTGVAGTLSVWATSTAAAYEAGAVIQTAVALTQASLSSPTPIPPTPLPSDTLPPPTATRRPTFTPAPPEVTIIPSGAITLSGAENLGDMRVSLAWEAEGSFINGFIVVYSRVNGEPAYPDDYWARFGNGAIRSAEVTAPSPGSYTFRVCEVDGAGKCTNYSNAFPWNVE